MYSRIIGLFLEDIAQERYIQELVKKIVARKGIEAEFRSYVSRGGRPAVFGELRGFFRLRGVSSETPDWIIVGNDGNCQGFVSRRNEVLAVVPSEWRDRVILAIPDPHIEAWFFRDISAFHRAVGPCDAPPTKKCDKDLYKEILRERTIQAVGLAPLGGIENAGAIVDQQDLVRLKASGTDLKSFVSGVESIA